MHAKLFLLYTFFLHLIYFNMYARCYSWLTMLSTGIGSLPFYFFTDLGSIWIGLSNGKNEWPIYICVGMLSGITWP